MSISDSIMTLKHIIDVIVKIVSVADKVIDVVIKNMKGV